MATINPNSISFTYKQYDTAPVGQLVTVTNMIVPGYFSLSNVPSWLTILSENVEDDMYSENVIFTVNTSVANTLSPGSYTAIILFMSADQADKAQNEGYLTVNLEVEKTVQISVSSLNVTFNHTIGAANPEGKLIQVTAENNWTVSKSEAWVIVTPDAGSNNGFFNITVETSGLAAATHSATVIVSDGITSVEIDVSLLVSDGNTVDDYLYVAPNDLDFTRNIGASFSKTSTVSVNSSAAWIATVSAPWITLNKTSGSAGTDTVEVATDISSIPAGNYVGEVIFTKDNFIKKVYVALQVSESITNAPINGEIYFAKDLIKVIMSSGNANSFLQVDFNATLAAGNSVYYKKTPFIKGVATAIIGEESVNLIKSIIPPEVLTTSAVQLITPISINFTAYERDYYTSETFEQLERNSLLFLNGKTPETSNKLSYLPAQITVSNKAVVILNVFSLAAPTTINITGAVADVVDVSLTANKYVYTAMVNLAEYNLKELDVITVTFGTQEVEIRIKKTPAESLTLAFENEWQLPEFFEITGELIIASTANFTTQTLQEDTNTHERIVSAAPGASFTLLTGYVESEAEIAWLDKIKDTKRCFLYIDGEQIEVIPTFKSLEIYKTRKHQSTYKLTFKKAIR